MMRHRGGLIVGCLMGVGVLRVALAGGGGLTGVVSSCPLANNGVLPNCDLTMVGSTMYGTVTSGGTYGKGTLVQRLGDIAFLPIYHFGSIANDGNGPLGKMLALGTNFYVMTSGGGVSNAGTIFSVGLGGTGAGVLHHFTGGATNGASPMGSLLPSGSMLYGTTWRGGVSNQGIAFSYATGLLRLGQTRFTVLHHFTGTANDGSQPWGGPALVGTNLYGLTSYGGISNGGTLFRMNTDGTGYTNLHAFSSAVTNGYSPLGELVVTNGMLYGTTAWGGSAGYGVIFSYNTGLMLIGQDRFKILHHFTGAPGDGRDAQGSLCLSGTNLYGLTAFGGALDQGTLYRLNLDGSGYTNLMSFINSGTGPNAGALPIRSPMLLGRHLYGCTYMGGALGSGTFFRVDLPTTPKLLFQNPSGLMAAWTLNTTGGVAHTALMDNTGGWALKAAGDIDGDGVADLLFQNASHDTGGWFMNLDGTHRSASFWWPTGEWEIKACADYDGLGTQFGVSSRAQVIFQRPDGTVARWLLNPDGSLSNSVILGTTSGWTLRGACDLDGDGKADLIFQNAVGDITVWTHNADNSIHVQLMPGTSEWALSGTVDVDGDAIPDLIWQTPDSRTGGWFMNTNLTARSASFWWPTPGWKLKAAGR